MSEEDRKKGRKYAEMARSATAEFRARRNAEGRARAEAEHREWQEHFRAGYCTICEAPLTSFDVGTPCLHWLLVPAGFTKHHFMQVAQAFSFFQIQLFLRRVANEEAFAKNINDLSGEGTGKMIEMTIRWGDYEWAFSCSESDYQGHQSASEQSRLPHYHCQMRRKKAAFIRYNDFHIPFHPSDIQTIEAQRAAPGFVHPMFAGGEGMADILNEKTLDALIHSSTPTSDEREATTSLSTMIVADEGTTLRGEDLLAIFDEAREKGVSVASLVPKLKGVRARTIVSPGDGVVEQAPRSGGRKRRGE